MLIASRCVHTVLRTCQRTYVHTYYVRTYMVVIASHEMSGFRHCQAKAIAIAQDWIVAIG